MARASKALKPISLHPPFQGGRHFIHAYGIRFIEKSPLHRNRDFFVLGTSVLYKLKEFARALQSEGRGLQSRNRPKWLPIATCAGRCSLLSVARIVGGAAPAYHGNGFSQMYREKLPGYGVHGKKPREQSAIS
jgi:hypothetical protein